MADAPTPLKWHLVMDCLNIIQSRFGGTRRGLEIDLGVKANLAFLAANSAGP